MFATIGTAFGVILSLDPRLATDVGEAVGFAIGAGLTIAFIGSPLIVFLLLLWFFYFRAKAQKVDAQDQKQRRAGFYYMLALLVTMLIVAMFA